MAAVRQIAGIAYPYITFGRGLPKAAVGIDVYSSAILALFRTNQRSRVMRPTVGTNIQRLVFEITGPFLRARITQEIVDAIARDLPEVTIQNVNIQEYSTRVEVSVSYSVNGVVGQTGAVSYSRG